MTDLAMARVERAVAAAQKRAERIRGGMRSFVETRREIAAAYAERDWFTLGYESFDAYVESEFSESRLRLSADERREAVAELRRAGMSTRAIGSALGISKDTAARDLATVADETVPDRITGTDGREQPASRPAVTFREQQEAFEQANETPEPPVVDTPTAPAGGSGLAPAPAMDAPAPPQEPAARPTLRLAPDPDQVRAAEQRDARALLSRGVDLLAPPRWKDDHFQGWIKQLGADDEELIELKKRAEAAIAVLHRVIKEAGR